MRYLNSKWLALLGATALNAPAIAQVVDTGTALPQENAPEGTIGDIIVTAQKGASGQSAQRVPVAITAVSAELIKASQAVNIIDISHMAPNANFTSAATLPGFSNYSIRGIGVSGSTSSIDPAVNVVVDGMVYDFQGGTIQDAFDLEGVEILRGPQGILFGRNTTGGAVSLRSRRPSDQFRIEGEFTIGNYNRYDGALSIEGPLVSDKVLARLTVLHRERDGYYKDNNGGTFVPAPLNPTGIPPATEQGRLGSINNWVIRPTVVITPTDALDFSFFGEIVDMGGTGNGARVVRGYEGLIQSRFGYTPPSGKWETNQNSVGFTSIKTQRIVTEANWDVGIGKLTSVTGFRHVNYQFAFEDGLPFQILEFPRGNIIRSRQISEELRFASTFSEVVDFVAGFYFDKHRLQVQERRLQSNVLGNPNAATYFVTNREGKYVQKAQAYAGFANVNVHATEAMTLSAGGRYSWEKKELHIAPLGQCSGPGFTGCPSAYSDYEKSWGNFSPKLGAEYVFSPGVMGYASWTKGFRSGQFNGRAASVAQLGPVDPEEASSFEIGLKSTFWDRKARFNISAFYTKYDDLQLTILDGATQILQNAGAATFGGIEAELTLKPVKPLELNGSFGWTSSKYDRLSGPFAANLTIEQSLKKELLKAPEFTAYGSAAYTAEVDAETDMTARIAYSWRSHFYVDVLNSPAALQKSYGTLDLSLTATRGNISLTAFGRNVTGVQAKDLINTVIVPEQFGGEPATYGLTLGFSL